MTRDLITTYLDAHPDPKRGDMRRLHRAILGQMPKCRLWFLDGRNEEGRVVSNPSVGYGVRIIRYADGTAREFYQVGMSANTTGISVYLLGLEDKQYLTKTYAKKLGKASVTGYCIKFRKLDDIDLAVLETAIRDVVRRTAAKP